MLLVYTYKNINTEPERSLTPMIPKNSKISNTYTSIHFTDKQITLVSLMTKLAVLSFVMLISFQIIVLYNIYLTIAITKDELKLNDKQKNNILIIYYLLRPLYGFTQSLCLLFNFNFSNKIYGLCCMVCDRCCFECCKSRIKSKAKAYEYNKIPNK